MRDGANRSSVMNFLSVSVLRVCFCNQDSLLLSTSRPNKGLATVAVVARAVLISICRTRVYNAGVAMYH